MPVSFKHTKAESVLVEAIVTRYLDKLKSLDDDDVEAPSRLDLTMDIIACHANGCPLDLGKLHSFPDFDFVHDVSGIHGRIDRRTGKLTSFFVPRCAKGDSGAAQ